MIQKIVVDSRVAFVDKQNKFLFTKGELKIARKRYKSALVKKLVNR